MRTEIGKVSFGPNYEDPGQTGRGKSLGKHFFFLLEIHFASCKPKIYVADYSSAKDFDNI